jgi:hypothetical protein
MWPHRESKSLPEIGNVIEAQREGFPQWLKPGFFAGNDQLQNMATPTLSPS